jgi:energy-coupling factor transport system ATP-binding protein
MIAINNLHFRSLAIDALSLGPGITSVIGPNGSGKTTFLKLCAGITVPQSGSIHIDGLGPRQAEIGWVNEYPDRNILFETVFDEIASSLSFHHVPCLETTTRVNDCMRSMGIGHLRSKPIRNLSGGEKVLVAFASALVCKPKVLVLDECDSHLDANRSREVSALMRTCGVPYVLRCTQQMETAAADDYLIYFENGAVRHCGSPEDVFSSLATTPFYPLSWRCHV